MKKNLINQIKLLQKIARRKFVESRREDALQLGQMIAYQKVLDLLKQK